MDGDRRRRHGPEGRGTAVCWIDAGAVVREKNGDDGGMGVEEADLDGGRAGMRRGITVVRRRWVAGRGGWARAWAVRFCWL